MREIWNCFGLISSSQCISEENHSKSSTSKFTQDPQFKRECFTPSKHSGVCTELFSNESFEQNLTVRNLLALSLSLVDLHSQKTLYWWFVTSLWNVSSPQLDKNVEKQENNVLWTTGELLYHFSSKLSFVFRSNNDVSQQSQFHSFH